jgi:hypothetical protein
MGASLFMPTLRDYADRWINAEKTIWSVTYFIWVVLFFIRKWQHLKHLFM